MTTVTTPAFESFRIHDAPNTPNRGTLDPITVLLRDLGGRGQIIVEVFGSAWAHYFGAIGDETLRQFVAGCDEYYLATKLAGGTGRRLTKRDEEYLQRISRAVIAWARGEFDTA